MLDFFRQLFSGGGFLPHRVCFSDSGAIIALHVASDIAICIAYYSIPAILVYFVSRRRDVPFNWIFRLFGMFIFACGTTHLMEVVNVWEPMYRLSGVIKVWTAFISIVTVCALIPLIPKALALPSLAAANQSLEQANASLRRASSDLSRSNAELEQFAYVASHDLQEPLRMVTNYLDLVNRRAGERLTPEERRFLEYAVEGATRMRALIVDLLAYSRAGAEPARAPVPLDAVVDDALLALQQGVNESGARIERSPLPRVTGDRTQLLQVVQNLISNAVKYRSPQRPLVIRLSGERLADGSVTLRVADNGIGIDPEHRERVFQIFQRLHDQRAYPGTGIGLAVCKKIVEQHGGRIGIETGPEGGTVFVVGLPGAE